MIFSAINRATAAVATVICASFIDNCDYYLLIIGGRYGSLTEDGISFTESEYNYAVEKKKTVIALLHQSPGKIPFEKSEGNPVLRQRLDIFRERVSKDRLVQHWETIGDLRGNVALSMQHAIANFPAIGWVRADRAANEDVLADINTLRKEKEQLAAQLATFASLRQPILDLADMNEAFTFHAAFKNLSGIPELGKVERTWAQLFALIAPMLAEHPNEALVKLFLGKNLFAGMRDVEINVHNFETMRIQFEALGLIEVENLFTVNKTWALFWKPTPLGVRRGLEYRAVRRSVPT